MKINIKTMLYIGVLILFVISIYLISETYAVFETNSNGTADFSIGSWVIHLNSIDISSGETVSFSINSFNYSDSSHIANGVIAPGRSGYFDLILDPDGTDVSVRYDITLDMEEEYADNITYYVTTTDGTTIRTAEDTYSGIIDLNSIDNGDVATLRIVVEWVDNGSYNESDTALGLENNSSISIPAQINVVQYLGETIEEYSSSSE
jgi:hypothetical protein